MLNKDAINNDYFEWLFDIVCHDRFADDISYRKLLMCLHGISFKWSIRMDENRAKDGTDLRYRFSKSNGYGDEYFTDSPCSVLEMMIALSIRCEENFMDDTRYGDRTAQWFWGMINNLGLGSMHDRNFDKRYVLDTIDIFLNRKYEPNGRGGLFTLRHSNYDLRKVEIWHQLCNYLDEIETN